MPTFFAKKNQIQGNCILLSGEDEKHIRQVLRYQVGDLLDICDEEATRYHTKITAFTEKQVVCEIQEQTAETTELPVRVTLFQGLPKFDKMETIIQKTVELGVTSIIPVEMERSVAKWEPEKSEKKVERWNKIALEAAKQSGRQIVPMVQTTMKFKNSIENISKYDIVVLLYEKETAQTLKKALQSARQGLQQVHNIAIFVGPEGGISPKELTELSQQSNVVTVTVGPRILRTETAGMVALAMLGYEWEG